MAPAGRRRGPYSQAARVIVLLDLLRCRRHGLSLRELSDRLGVTPRQVRRDLGALAEAGYDVTSFVDGAGARRVKLTRTPFGAVDWTW